MDHHLVQFFAAWSICGWAAAFFLVDEPLSKKLYVGNLSYNITNASLEDLFAEHGTVRTAQVVTDRDTGSSKGFGFVEMADDQAANNAITALNDKEMDGRRMVVNEAHPREERSDRSGSRGGFRSRR